LARTAREVHIDLTLSETLLLSIPLALSQLRGEHPLKSQNLLPKRVVAYIQEMGVRTLDHLAERSKAKKASKRNEGATAAVQSLVANWEAMTTEDKEKFVERISASAIEVVAASAALPLGLKQGKRAVKETKKILERRAKELRKVTRRASAAGNPKKKDKGKAKDKAKSKKKG
jgi:hypothetical protein